ncbi:long-chain fatty acid-CoA ligase FAA4 [Ascoidea rubescens DSM 1968]|uniref:Long chain fatty acyl-CoA synthetase n=1 Tax=Ascoidea rubescens DSM 1968 TaxID=1344418 RepID=A0A1D2VLC1_9ASCO|nr:long chain fatty acyl-CoA synthetase [Ascoidea rubescens DSM 1968]ODV62409.1 long chain fatty acyl-CoA synthetase [Ascoidea rubescens DSM 1968]
MVKQANVIVGEARPGETAPRRNFRVPDGPVIKPLDSKAVTLYDLIQECLSRNPNNNCMGWRTLIDIHEEKKFVTKKNNGKDTQVEKTWLYYELGSYNYITKTQLNEIIHNYSKGLVKLGIQPNGQEKLHIFATTSQKWLQTFFAANAQAIPIVTAYDTLGEEGLIHSLIETESSAIFINNLLFPKLINPLKVAKNVRYIIHDEPIDPNDKRQNGKFFSIPNDAKQKIQELRPDIQFITYDQVIQLGKDNFDSIPPNPPKPQDVACVMYTSGSTGVPKGVILTHCNILAGIGGLSIIMDRNQINDKDRIIAFLPLAHIFELMFEIISFWWGGILGYGGVKTLTDLSLRNCQGDLKEFKPTVMVAVAAVWEAIRKGILVQIKKLPPLSQKIFWTAYKSKLFMKNNHIPLSGIFDVIFKKIKAATGGQLRQILNGGSPISVETQIFISNLIAPLLIGYGLTETVAQTCVLAPFAFEYDVAGMLTGSITVKLRDVPELGYFAKDDQGEVLISGAPVTPGYLNNDKENKESFTEDGWFCTGDIAEWTKTGQLKVIDRKKNLVKTANGEYIALEKLESTYRTNSLVANICCYADQTKVKPIALVVPNEPQLKKLAVELGLYESEDDVEFHSVVHDKKLKNAITKDLIKTGSSLGLAGIELIIGVVLVDEEWTPENNMLSAAHKLQRKAIVDSCKAEIEDVYNSN